jgi:hypothetical protein
MSDRMRLPRRERYGDGLYRRHVLVQASGDRVVAELEDDFHRFGVEVAFEGDRVARIAADSKRYPWVTCPAASNALEELVGAAVQSSLASTAGHTDPDRQCTHQLDLVCVAVAARALGLDRRRYEMAVPELQGGRTRPRLEVDGRARWTWTVEGTTILGPEPFAGRRLGGGFAAWAEQALEPAAALEAQLLRRATFIAFGRQYAFDAMPDPRAFAAATGTRCHSFLPGNVERATRVVGSARRFDERPGDLLRPDASESGA